MFGIYPNTIRKLNEIFDKYLNIEEVIIYGSRALGNYKEGSDIDMTINGNINNDVLFNIQSEIEDSLIPYMCDISVYNELKSDSLKNHIDRVGKLFYKKNKSPEE